MKLDLYNRSVPSSGRALRSITGSTWGYGTGASRLIYVSMICPAMIYGASVMVHARGYQGCPKSGGEQAEISTRELASEKPPEPIKRRQRILVREGECLRFGTSAAQAATAL